LHLVQGSMDDAEEAGERLAVEPTGGQTIF
jgi:hypothetical protein